MSRHSIKSFSAALFEKSFYLAFINILPIPGLDGGHALIAIIEGIIRRKLHPKIKMGFQHDSPPK